MLMTFNVIVCYNIVTRKPIIDHLQQGNQCHDSVYGIIWQHTVYVLLKAHTQC